MKNCVLSQNEWLLDFKGLPIHCGLTTIKLGNFALNCAREDQMNKFMTKVGATKCIRMKPEHKNRIVYRGSDEDHTLNPSHCDGILFESPETEFITFLHCGRKSLSQSILKIAVNNLATWAHIKPANIKAVVYSGICPSCYLVKDDVFHEFARQDRNYRQFFVPTNNQSYKFDLAGLINWQLMETGLSKGNIHRFDLCSHHHRFLDFNYPSPSHDGHKFLLFSQRRDEEKRNFFFAKFYHDKTVITGTTGNCPYVVLYSP